MTNSVTTTPLFTNDTDAYSNAYYEKQFAQVKFNLSLCIMQGLSEFTLDEIKEAFAEAATEYEENNN